MHAPALAVTRAVMATSGREALRRAWPPALAVCVVASVAFGPNGLTAGDVMGLARHHATVRAGMWCVWMALTLPAARALLRDPSLSLVRAQPVSHTRLVTVLSTLLAVGDAPWVAFRARGGGALDALATALSTVVGQWALAVPPRRAVARVAAVSLGAAVVAATDPREVIVAAVFAGAVVLPRACVEMGEFAQRAVWRQAVSPRATIALAQCVWRATQRTARAAMARAVALAGVTAALLATVLRGRVGASLGALCELAMTAATVSSAVVGATTALAVWRARRGLDDLLRVGAMRRVPVGLATVAPCAAVSAMVTLATVAPAMAFAHATMAERAVAVGAAAVWSAAVGALALWVTSRVRGATPTLRVAVWMLLVTAALWMAVSTWGVRAVWITPCAVALAVWEASR